jgi:predicted ribosome quality control (RQC) complex YloA/Tae2 family protein
MPFDAPILRAVAEDLQQHLAGGRVDKVVQPAALSVALLLRAEFANQWLLISAHAQQANVHRTAEKQSGGFSEPSPFVMLLRKYLEGARLIDAAQVGVDRVLKLRFQRGEDEVALLCEIMGRYSNAVLVDAGSMVLGALKLVHAEENRVRVVLPRHAYAPPPTPSQPPPMQDRAKIDPLHGTAGDLAAGLARLEPEALLWKALLDLVDGLSPSAAREAVFHLTGSLDAPAGAHRDLQAATALLSFARGRFAPDRGAPSAVWREGKLLDYAAFPLYHHGLQPILYPGIMDLLGAVLTAPAAADPLAGQRVPMLTAIEALARNARRKIASLQASLVPKESLAAMRLRGEMLLAYQHALEPGARVFEVPETGLRFPLDPTLTAVENAQRQFKQYSKARDAGRVVPALLDTARQELAYLEQLAVLASLAGDPQSLAAVREELRDLSLSPEEAVRRARKQTRQVRQGAKPAKANMGAGPLRLRAADGTEILVGRSARQNDALTFTLAGPQDLWLHARQIPGAHVIMRLAGRPAGGDTLLLAAALAAAHSQARGATSVPVDYTLVRNVHRIKGAKPGLVHYSGETTVNVRPDPELARRSSE